MLSATTMTHLSPSVFGFTQLIVARAPVGRCDSV